MRVSVCIPTFNKARYLKRAIESVLAQRFQDFELVVLDDASSDGTPKLAESFKDPRVRYIRHRQNIGLPENFNQCLRVVNRECVIIFHDDDVMLPDLLAREVEILDCHPDVAFVHAAVQLIDAMGQVYSVPPQFWPPFTEGLEFVRRYWSGVQSGVVMSTVMFRRSVALKLGGFDVNLKYTLDADLWQRMAFEGQVAFIDDVLLANRVHADQATSKILSNRLQMLEERLKYAEATRKLVEIHHANLDSQISRNLSLKIATDLTELRALDASVRHILAYALAAVRIHPRVLIRLRLFPYLALALFPSFLVRALKRLHGRWFLWSHAACESADRPRAGIDAPPGGGPIKRRLRVLAVEPYTRIPGHGAWFAARTCRGLAFRGHDTTLLTFGGIDPGLLQEGFLVTVVDAGSGRNRKGAVLSLPERANRSPRISARERIVLELRTFQTALSLVNEANYDIVHFFDFHPLTLLFAMCFFLSKRAAARTAVVANLHFASRLQREEGPLRAAYNALYRGALASLIKRWIRGLIVLDPSFKRELRECLKLDALSNERIMLLPHGMDVDEAPCTKAEARRRLRLDDNETLLLFFGILRRDKGLDIAIEAMRGFNSCRLLVVGSPYDWDRSAIRDLVRQQRCEDSVSLEVGYVDEMRMRDYFLASDAVLVPYSRSFQERGQSGILTRACTYGRCVIASDVGTVGETVRAHGIGLLAEPENPEKLREAISKFLRLTPAERGRMESQAKLLARQQSWEAVCEQLEQQYYSVIDKDRRP